MRAFLRDFTICLFCLVLGQFIGFGGFAVFGTYSGGVKAGD